MGFEYNPFNPNSVSFMRSLLIVKGPAIINVGVHIGAKTDKGNSESTHSILHPSGLRIHTHQRERRAPLLPALFFLSLGVCFVCVRVHEGGPPKLESSPERQAPCSTSMLC